MEVLDTLHPIRILAQPDADLTSVLHSFFVLSVDPSSQSLKVLVRHPLVRKNIDHAEDGIKQLLNDPKFLYSDVEKCVCHVMTNHDGRLYLFARCLNQKIIALVSSWPIVSFFRMLFSYLENAPIDCILPTIYTFCEFPIVPLPSVNYKFEFGASSSTISFGALQNIEETDFDAIALTVLSPFMMLKAWEALILERSILIVSKNKSLLLPCCEFLRKLLSPMTFTGTYVPEMPSAELLEATGTYLMGIDVRLFHTTEDVPQLSGIVVLQLDQRAVYHAPIPVGTSAEENYFACPPFLQQIILDSLTSIMQDSLGNWFQRPLNQGYTLESIQSNVSSSRRCTDILKYFSFINSVLMSAQLCSVNAFWHTEKMKTPFIYQLFQNPLSSSSMKSNSGRPPNIDNLGFQEIFGFVVGSVQLWKYAVVENDMDEKNNDQSIHNASFCWIELDQNYLTIYEFADDLPLFLIPVAEIEAVTPSPKEPLGHVFEVSLNNLQFLRFTCEKIKTRHAWISVIESRISQHRLRKVESASNFPQPPLTPPPSSTYAESKKYFHVTIEQMGTQNYPNFYSLNYPGIVENSYHVNTGSQKGNEEDKDNFRGFSVKNLETTAFSSLNDLPLLQLYHYQEFRNLIWKTQNFISLNSNSQSSKFETLFTQRRENFTNYLSNKHSYSSKMKKFISPTNQITNLLREITQPPAPQDFHLHCNTEDGTENGISHESTNLIDSIHSETVPPDKPEKSSESSLFASSFLSKIFSSKSTSKRNVSTIKPSEPPSISNPRSRSVTPLMDTETQLQERETLLLLKELLKLSLSYKCTLSELNNSIFSDRYQILQRLMTESIEKQLFLSFNVQELIEPGSAIGNEIANKYNMSTKQQTSMSVRKQYESYLLPTGISSLGEDNAKFEDLFDSLVAPAIAISRSLAYVAMFGPNSESDKVEEPPKESQLQYSAPSSAIHSRKNSFVNLESLGKTLEIMQNEENTETDDVDYFDNQNGLSSNVQNPLLPIFITPPGTPCRASIADQEIEQDMFHDLSIPLASLQQIPEVTNLPVEEVFNVNAFFLADDYEKSIISLHSTVRLHLLEYFYSIERLQTNKDHQIHDDDQLLPSKSSLSTQQSLFILPIITTLIGYVLFYLEDYSNALKYYSKYNLIHQSRVAQCLLKIFLKSFASSNFSSEFDECKFIHEHLQIKSTVGMHAYRLILELIETEIKNEIEIIQPKKQQMIFFDPSFDCHSFRLFLRSSSSSAAAAKGNHSTLQFQSSIYSNKFSSLSLSSSSTRIKYECIENPHAILNPKNMEIFNEKYICTKLLIESSNKGYCQLTIQLLWKLKEMIRSFAFCEKGEKFYKRINDRTYQIDISEQSLYELQDVYLTAFMKFDMEICQLQKVDLNVLTLSGRLLFFVNIYNLLTIHAIIIRGNPGSSNIERAAFLRNSKYNIGGFIFSLIEIEHGILRNASSKAKILGPLSIDYSFSEKDPRRKFALEIPFPNISFVLFMACKSTSNLCILSNVQQIEQEVKQFTKQYLLENVKFDYQKKLINLPAIIKAYWSDFGGNQNQVFRYLSKHAGSQFTMKLREYVTTVGSETMKIHFQSWDWYPIFLLQDD